MMSPHELADKKFELTGEYSFFAGQLEDILVRKPAVWNAKRSDFKSDAACDRWWEATEDGINETGLRIRMKRIEKEISAINSLLRVAEGEAKNEY